MAFFYKPYNFGQIYMLTLVAFYIFYFIFNVRVVVNLIRNKEEFRVGVKKMFLL